MYHMGVWFEAVNALLTSPLRIDSGRIKGFHLVRNVRQRSGSVAKIQLDGELDCALSIHVIEYQILLEPCDTANNKCSRVSCRSASISTESDVHNFQRGLAELTALV
jgi:hypothetical protein